MQILVPTQLTLAPGAELSVWIGFRPLRPSAYRCRLLLTARFAGAADDTSVPAVTYKIPLLGFGGAAALSVGTELQANASATEEVLLSDSSVGDGGAGAGAGSSPDGGKVAIMRVGPLQRSQQARRKVFLRNSGSRTAFVMASVHNEGAAETGAPPRYVYSVTPSHFVVPPRTTVAVQVSITRSSVAAGVEGGAGLGDSHSSNSSSSTSRVVKVVGAMVHFRWGDEYARRRWLLAELHEQRVAVVPPRTSPVRAWRCW